MRSYEVRIEGASPLICNRFTDAAQQAATGGTRLSLVGDRGSPREQAENKLYRGINGDLIIPQPNLFRALIDGGQFFKAGKSKVTTQQGKAAFEKKGEMGVAPKILTEPGEAWLGKAGPGAAWQGKARHGRARQGNTKKRR